MFVGIDLGTTNSVIAFSKVKSDARVVASPIDIERYVSSGIGLNGDVKYTKAREKTLPSCVYYKNGEAIVGDGHLINQEDVWPDIAENFLVTMDKWQRADNVHLVVPEYLKSSESYLVKK